MYGTRMNVHAGSIIYVTIGDDDETAGVSVIITLSARNAYSFFSVYRPSSVGIFFYFEIHRESRGYADRFPTKTFVGTNRSF